MTSHPRYLDGQMLIAMPMIGQSAFLGGIVYLCAHSSQGAMGIMINRPAPNVRFPDLLVRLEVIREGELITLPRKASIINVVQGGPVESNRGFVLHSDDYFIDSTLPIDDGICLTATIEILRAIASGQGPENAMLALGYASWSPGSLEIKIRGNTWLHCPADPELLFGNDPDRKYQLALRKIGVDPARLSTQRGQA